MHGGSAGNSQQEKSWQCSSLSHVCFALLRFSSHSANTHRSHESETVFLISSQVVTALCCFSNTGSYVNEWMFSHVHGFRKTGTNVCLQLLPTFKSMLVFLQNLKYLTLHCLHLAAKRVLDDSIVAKTH